MSLSNFLNMDDPLAKKIYEYQNGYAAKYSNILLGKRVSAGMSAEKFSSYIGVDINEYKTFESGSLAKTEKEYEKMIERTQLIFSQKKISVNLKVDLKQNISVEKALNMPRVVKVPVDINTTESNGEQASILQMAGKFFKLHINSLWDSSTSNASYSDGYDSHKYYDSESQVAF
ncbi:hypothetical protein [Lactiplantibacillus plantarum]|uniref:hypothetical protein n=1 Tax=Lactiplantibacillus plantarum TaxID=1590 RepID=UPI001F4D1AFD|nr:hypothetical protein [Lactiplantibacillus plantarum]MCH8624492.1 hypothetical protein [Lactiplantibacillus plantarum]